LKIRFDFCFVHALVAVVFFGEMAKRKGASGMSRSAPKKKSRKAKAGATMKMFRSPAERVYPVTRYASVTDEVYLTGSAPSANVVLEQYIFSLDKLAGMSDFVNLFEFYKIVAVQVEVRMINVPEGTTYPASTVANQLALYPRMWYRASKSSTAIVSTNPMPQIRELGDIKSTIIWPNKIFKSTVKDLYTQTSVINSSILGSSYAETAKAGWMRTAIPTIEHHGFELCFDSQSIALSQNFNFRVDFKYFVEFKGIK
jgi:hypothetical protein